MFWEEMQGFSVGQLDGPDNSGSPLRFDWAVGQLAGSSLLRTNDKTINSLRRRDIFIAQTRKKRTIAPPNYYVILMW
jgi:hypothetical protein